MSARILFVVAMEAEAGPIRRRLGIGAAPDRLHPRFPAQLWVDDGVAVAANGHDERFGVDSISTQPAVTTTLHAIERFEPTLVVSTGTAGGFRRRGGDIGSVYLADRVVFHDRRVNLPMFDRYGVGDYPVADLSAVATSIDARTRFPVATGTVSSGNALDAPEVDRELMDASETVAKDMEAAAVAWVCEQMDTPFSALKAITDMVDTEEATGEQFLRNLATATDHLATAVAEFVAELR